MGLKIEFAQRRKGPEVQTAQCSKGLSRIFVKNEFFICPESASRAASVGVKIKKIT